MPSFLPALGRAVAASAAVAAVAAAGAVALPGGERAAQAAAVAPPAGWVSHLNEMRAAYGSPPVAVDAALSAAAEQHALYMAQNGELAKTERPGRPRYSAAGHAAASKSLLAGPGFGGEDTPDEFLDLWSRGAFTALAMLHPAVDRIGYGQSVLGSAEYAALDVQTARAESRGATGWPRTWPGSATLVRPVAYTGDERPSPLTGCGTAPAEGWGLPLVVSYGPGARPVDVTASLTSGGASVQICVVQADTATDAEAIARLDEANSVVLLARGPLRQGQSYSGTVTSSRGTARLAFSVAAAGQPTQPKQRAQPTQPTRPTQPPTQPTAPKPALVAASAWQRLPGGAYEIGVGGSGAAWVIGRTKVGGGYSIHRWTGSAWQTVPGGAVRVDVDRNGVPWIIDSSGVIYRRVGSSWVRMPGLAREIGIGADDSVWILGRGAVGGGHSIYRWNGKGWTPVAGGATALDVDRNGQPWIVNNAGSAYRRTAAGWQRLPGLGRDISAGADGSVWMTSRAAAPGGNAVYRWNGAGWTLVEGGAVRLDADGDGKPWIVGASGSLSRRLSKT